MDWILTSVVDWVYRHVIGAAATIGSMFSGIMDINGADTLNAFWIMFLPGVNDGDTSTLMVMMVLGLFIMYSITIFQILKAFGGNINRSEDPRRIIAKTALTTILVTNSYTLCKFIMSFATAPYALIRDDKWVQGEAGTDFNIEGWASMGSASESVADSTESAAKNVGIDFSASVIVALISLTIVFAIMIAYIKLLIEVVERYVLTGVLTVFSPLAIACCASDATSRIFSTWLRLMISQMVLMCASVFFMSIAQMAFSRMGDATAALVGLISAENSTGAEAAASLMAQLMLLAWLRIGSQFDNHLNTLGISALRAGDGLTADLLAANHMKRQSFNDAKKLGRSIRSAGSSAHLAAARTGAQMMVNRQVGAKEAKAAGLRSKASQVGGFREAMAVNKEAKAYAEGIRGSKRHLAETAAMARQTGATQKLGLDAVKGASQDAARSKQGQQFTKNSGKIDSATVDKDGVVTGSYSMPDGSRGTFQAKMDKDGNMVGFHTTGHTGGQAALGNVQSKNGSGFSMTGTDRNGNKVTGNGENVKDLSATTAEGKEISAQLPAGFVNQETGVCGKTFDKDGNIQGAVSGTNSNYDCNGNQLTLDDNGRITAINGQKVDENGVAVSDSNQTALMTTDENGNEIGCAGTFDSGSLQLSDSSTDASPAIDVDGNTFQTDNVDANDPGRFAPEVCGPNEVATVNTGTQSGATAMQDGEKNGLLTDGKATESGNAVTDASTGVMHTQGQAIGSITGADGRTKPVPLQAAGNTSEANAFNKAAQDGTNLASLQNKETGNLEANIPLNKDGTVDVSKCSEAALAVGLASGMLQQDSNGIISATDRGITAAGSNPNAGSGGGEIAISAPINAATGQSFHADSSADGAKAFIAAGTGDLLRELDPAGDGFAREIDPAGDGITVNSNSPLAASMMTQNADGTTVLKAESNTALTTDGQHVLTGNAGGIGGIALSTKADGVTLDTKGMSAAQTSHLVSSGMAVPVTDAKGNTTGYKLTEQGQAAMTAPALCVNTASDGKTLQGVSKEQGQAMVASGLAEAVTSSKGETSYQLTEKGQAAAANGEGRASHFAVLAAQGLARQQADGTFVTTSRGNAALEANGSISHSCALSNASYSAGDRITCSAESGAALCNSGMATAVMGADGKADYTNLALTEKGAQNVHSNAAGGMYIDAANNANNQVGTSTVQMSSNSGGAAAQSSLAVCTDTSHGGRNAGIAYQSSSTALQRGMNSGVFEKSEDTGAISLSASAVPNVQRDHDGAYVNVGGSRVNLSEAKSYQPVKAAAAVVAAGIASGVFEKSGTGAVSLSGNYADKVYQKSDGNSYVDFKTSSGTSQSVCVSPSVTYTPSLVHQQGSAQVNPLGVPVQSNGHPDIVPSSIQYGNGAMKFSTSNGQEFQFLAAEASPNTPVPKGSMRVGNYIVTPEAGYSGYIQSTTRNANGELPQREKYADVLSRLNSDTTYAGNQLHPVSKLSDTTNKQVVVMKDADGKINPCQHKLLKAYKSGTQDIPKGASFYVLTGYRGETGAVDGTKSSVFDKRNPDHPASRNYNKAAALKGSQRGGMLASNNQSLRKTGRR